MIPIGAVIAVVAANQNNIIRRQRERENAIKNKEKEKNKKKKEVIGVRNDYYS